MKKLLKNNVVVGLLAVAAVYTVYARVVSPIMDMNQESARSGNTDFEDFNDLEDTEYDDGYAIEVARNSESARGKISIQSIHWNDQPTRDPFAPESAIKDTQRSAISDMLKNPVSHTRNTIQKVALPRVSAVINAPSLKFAVIDGDILQEGDVHKRFHVNQIKTGKVYLSHSGNNQIYEVTVTE